MTRRHQFDRGFAAKCLRIGHRPLAVEMVGSRQEPLGDSISTKYSVRMRFKYAPLKTVTWFRRDAGNPQETQLDIFTG